MWHPRLLFISFVRCFPSPTRLSRFSFLLASPRSERFLVILHNDEKSFRGFVFFFSRAHLRCIMTAITSPITRHSAYERTHPGRRHGSHHGWMSVSSNRHSGDRLLRGALVFTGRCSPFIQNMDGSKRSGTRLLGQVSPIPSGILALPIFSRFHKSSR